MESACHYSASGAAGVHQIADGARRLQLVFNIDWGDQDLRDSHEKPLVFCSFEHLSLWAAERAADHDQHMLARGGLSRC